MNFADAAARVNIDARLAFRYGKAVDSRLLKSFGAMLYRINFHNKKQQCPFFLTSLPIEDKEISKYDLPLHPSRLLILSRNRILRNVYTQVLAAKGGNNNESHNHNNEHFSIWIDNTPLIIDAGVGTYTRQTFSKDRYKIWSMQSGWHNLPVINGQEQYFGAQYHASDVKARKGHFELNLKDAYPESAGIKEWNSILQHQGQTSNDR